MENSLAVPLEVKHGVTILSSSSTTRYISKKNENICLHKNLYRMFMKYYSQKPKSINNPMSTK